MRKIKIIVIMLVILFWGFPDFVKAQEPMVSETWHIKATDGHFDNRPKISSEFQLSAPGVIKIDAAVDPYCRCSNAGHQYFVFQHRLKSSPDGWEKGVAYTRDLKSVVYTPEEWVDGKRLVWTYQLEILPGAEKYVYRILLFPNHYWTGNGHFTPEQILAIAVTSLSQNSGTTTGKPQTNRRNLAKNRPALQSSNSEWSNPDDAQGAVDGVKNGSFGFHTNNEENPWWQVDLGGVTNLNEIRIFNRLDYCSDRARTIQVLLSDDGVNWTQVFANDGSIFGGHDGKPLRVSVKGYSARFVRLQLNETNFFHLDEVEIY